jgi:hypothetical protein
VNRIEFGNGLRSHIAREPEPPLAGAPLGPIREPVQAAEPEQQQQQSTSAEWVRDLLRIRAGEQAERIWSVFDEALRATDAHGRPDHELRLRAARALLAEIEGTATAVPRQPVADDELAKLRRARHGEPPGRI